MHIHKQPNKRVQVDQITRCASALAANAERYTKIVSVQTLTADAPLRTSMNLR